MKGADDQELRRQYARSDIVVLPSLIEGFGLVYLEALASGCYCLGTENTGLPDVVSSESIGLVFPVGSVDRLSEALENAYRKWRASTANRPRRNQHVCFYFDVGPVPS